MKKTDFIDLVEQPGLLNEASMPLLKEVIEEFPWFQSARMLLVKNLHVLDDMHFNKELKNSAAYIANRKRLYEIINQQFEIKSTKPEENKPDGIDVSLDKKSRTEERVNTNNVGITANVKTVDDYFQTDDVFETAQGNKIDFSVSTAGSKDEIDNNSLILPSADFLEYESSDYVGYELKDLNPEDENEENRSFSDWLSVLRHSPAKKEEDDTHNRNKSRQIIDNFLNVDLPKIVPSLDRDIKNKDLGKKPDEEKDSDNEDLMTETLAGIYTKQKYYEKAINIYKRLCLKYPEKNAYFAQRIKDLEKLNN